MPVYNALFLNIDPISSIHFQITDICCICDTFVRLEPPLDASITEAYSQTPEPVVKALETGLKS